MLRKENIKAIYNLSPLQEGMLFYSKYNPDSQAYFNQVSYRIRGTINLEVVRKSLQDLYERHDILRTVFIQKTTDRPLQVVLREREVDFAYHAIGNSNEKFVENFKEEDRRKNFDLSKDLLMRVAVIGLGETEFEFIWSFHHILMDGWCVAVLTKEFHHLYNANLSGKARDLPPVTPYKKYIEWLDKQDKSKATSFWENYLKDFTKPTSFLKKHSATPITGFSKKQKVNLSVPKIVYKDLLAMAARNNVTLNTIIQTTWGVLLGRYNNTQDVVFGSVVSARPSELPWIESMIGLFINTIPVRITVDLEDSFTAALKKIQNETIESLNYQYAALAEVQSLSELKQNLFDHIVVFENYPVSTQIEGLTQDNANAEADFKVLHSEFFDEDSYGLGVTITQGETLNITLEYSEDTYDGSFIKRLLGQLEYFFNAIISDSDSSVKDLIVSLSDEEKHEILFDFNNTDTDYQLDRTIISFFEENADRMPDNIAVISGHEKLTYKELNRRANQVATYLLAHGLQKEEIVPIACHRSVELLVGIIGVFKAGGAFVLLDTTYPVKRICLIIADVRSWFILTTVDAFDAAHSFYENLCKDTGVKHLLYLDKAGSLAGISQSVNTLRLHTDLQTKGISDDGYDRLRKNSGIQFRYNGQSLSNPSLQELVTKFSEYLKSKIHALHIVGVLMDNPIYGIVTMLALKELKIDPLIIEPDLSRKNLHKFIREHSVSMLISQNKFVDEIDAVLWELEPFNAYILIDGYKAGNEKDKEWEAGIKEIFDYETSKGVSSSSDYGWVSSYTGKPLSKEEMQEYIDNFTVKLSPYLTPETNVLEIGSGQGLVMNTVASRTGFYMATDLCEAIVKINAQSVSHKNINNIDFKVLPASEIHTVKSTPGFDVVICSSVLQYFPNTLYLEDVIRQAIQLLNNKGIIYIDDILDLNKKEEVILANKKYNEDFQVRTAKVEWDEDLFVAHSLWYHLQQKFPEIAEVQISERAGSIENELKKFRYDLILKIDKTNRPVPSALVTTKNRYRDFDLGIDFNTNGVEATQPWSVDAGDTVIAVNDRGDLERLSDRNPGVTVNPLDLSFIIYTSGSTGKPKGAMNEHIGMLNHCLLMIDNFKITGTSTIAQTAPISFDIIVWQLLTALITGGKTILYPKELLLNPVDFAKKLRDDHVTLLQLVPSYLTVFLEELEKEDEKFQLPDLTDLIVCGEAIRPQLVKRWFSQFPAIKMTNAYGPAEASDDVTMYAMDDTPDSDFISIGKPVANCHILILDHDMRLCPVGYIGEICVSGLGVGKGYINDENKTKAVFTDDPFRPGNFRLYKTGDLGRWLPDGNIEFLGRKDYQVKIRGQRVELGEIESRIMQMKGVKDVVITDFLGDSGISICAYVILDESSYQTMDDIRKALDNELPDFMIPEYFTELKAFPLSSNGKVNRKALPKPVNTVREKFTPPSNDIEEKLVVIWENILGRDRISIDDNFFEIGGHSLKATQLISRIHKELNIKFPLKTIFTSLTIKGLAVEISNINWIKSAQSSTLIDANLDEISI